MPDRREALRKLCDEFYIDPESTASTGDEDAGFYFRPEDDEDHKPILPYVAVTGTAGDNPRHYVYADFEALEAAQLRATDDADDPIFSEIPVAVVNLDTGARWVPCWRSLQWSYNSPHALVPGE